LPCDGAGSFERQHHLVNRWRVDAELFLDVGFGRARRPSDSVVDACLERGHAMNVCYRVELSQIERTALRTLLSGGKHASRKLKRAQILLAADAGTSDEEIARSVGVGGPCTGPSDASWKASTHSSGALYQTSPLACCSIPWIG
jgi:hypothetical protein